MSGVFIMFLIKPAQTLVMGNLTNTLYNMQNYRPISFGTQAEVKICSFFCG